jgi:hypothetical protein
MRRTGGEEKMSSKTDISNQEIDAVLIALNELCDDEYGETLDEVRCGRDREVAALRLQRLTGILLKQHFAKPKKRTDEHPESRTGAKRIWTWNRRKLAAGVTGAEAEFELLNRLRGPGVWNERWDWPAAEKEPDGSALTWDEFINDVDSERGLFKVTALYLKDVLTKKDRKRIAEYYRAEETETLKRGLDLSVILAGAALAPLYAAVGVPSVAVGLAIFLADIGAAKLFSEDRYPDNWA